MCRYTERFPKRYKPLPLHWYVIAHVDENANEILVWTATNLVLNFESDPFYSKYECRRFILKNYIWIEREVFQFEKRSVIPISMSEVMELRKVRAPS